MALGLGTRLGRYELLGRLGKGGMGEVYRARDPELDREVAIKVLPSDVAHDRVRLQRFRREARVVARLGHPNVLTVHDVGTRRGSPFLVTELLEGETLRRRLERGPPPVARALEWATQVARGLAAAHARGVVHRDLKPENVFLTRDGGAKILDFGVAKLLYEGREPTPDSPTQTDPAARMGTPGYMSPEQVRGLPLDHRSDIFSLGSLLLEMLCGEPPFRRETPAETMTAILREEPLALASPDIGPGLRRLAKRCLDKERDRRFQSAHDLALALEALSETNGVAGEGAGEAETPERPPPGRCARRGPDAGGPETGPLVARDHELGDLGRRLEAALAGQGQVVFVTGEAGTGKTALAGDFARRAQREQPDLVVAGGRCNAHTGIGDPYLPFREILGLLTGDVEARLAAGSITGDHASRLRALLPVVARSLADSGGDLLDTFVSTPALMRRAEAHAPDGGDWVDALRRTADRRAGGAVDASPAQANLFGQYADAILAAARHRPLILILDDLQWADAGSIGLLFHLARQVAASRVLVMGLYRPSEIALGRGGERHPLEAVVNELQRITGAAPVLLGDEGDRAFVDALLDSEPNRLGRGFRDALFRRTRGHALFTVELLRGLKEQGMVARGDEGRWIPAPGLTWGFMPARVEGVIAERVGRLSPLLRRVLTVASLEGEEFTAEAIAPLVGLEPAEFIRLLSDELDRRHHLVTARGFQRRDAGRLSRYRFRHFLFQKYLSDRLDPVERAVLHEGLGRALEKLHGDGGGTAAVELARHFEAAGLVEKAVGYRRVSGDRAGRASAYEEAGSHYRRALELLGGQPEGRERARAELELQIALTTTLFVSRGYGVPEASRTLVRARELADLVGDMPRRIGLAAMQCGRLWCRAEHRASYEAGQECLRLAEESGDAASVVGAHAFLGPASCNLGRLTEGCAHLEKALGLYDPERHRTFVLQVLGHEPRVFCHAFLSFFLWPLGLPERALRHSREAEAEARRISHPHSLAHASYFTAFLHAYRRDPDAALERAEVMERLDRERGFPVWGAAAAVVRGWCQAQGGRAEEALPAMEAGIDGWRGAGMEISRPSFLAMLAEACSLAGRRGTALERVDEAIAATTATGESLCDAELHRLKGELLRAEITDRDGEAESCFRRAVQLARGQKAKSWELRAATSLARLLAERDRRDEARAELAGVYGWFTEGFDTPDLRDARALLDDLA